MPHVRDPSCRERPTGAKKCRAVVLAVVVLAVLANLAACSAPGGRAPDQRGATSFGSDSSREVDPASIGGYERPPYYRIPPNYPFREGGARAGEGVDLLPWLVSEAMLWEQRLAGAQRMGNSILVKETWFSVAHVVRINDKRQLVLTLVGPQATQAYVNMDNVGWLFADAFAKYGADNVGLEITVDAQATLNAMLVGLRPEWYFLQPELADVIRTHIETVDRSRLRSFIAATLKEDVPPGDEAEAVTDFFIQVLVRKSMLEELRSTSPDSTFRTYYVTSVFFGLDASTKAVANRIGLSSAQITQIESAMYKRMSGPLVNASGMRGRKRPATVIIPVRKFFDPAYAPENKEDARGWGLVPLGKGRPTNALPAKIFLAFGVGLGPDSVPVANRFPDRFTLDEWNLEPKDLNAPGDSATILGMRLVPLQPLR